MLKNTLIIALVIVLIYLYYQNRKRSNSNLSFLADTAGQIENSNQNLAQNIQIIQTFLKEQLNSNSLEELKTKLGEKTLNELLEENEDYETEVDTLTRTKNSLEQDLTAQAEAFQSRIREKDREVKKLKEDLKDLEKVRENLTSEKQQHKGSLERISLLTKQVGELEQEKRKLEEKVKKMPGEFPEAEDKSELASEHQEQLRKVKDFREWLSKDSEQETLFKKVDWDYYENRENWITDFQNWNRLQPKRIELLKKWLEND